MPYIPQDFEELLRMYHELNGEHQYMLNKYLVALDIIEALNRFYPYVLGEVSTKDQLDELLG